MKKRLGRRVPDREVIAQKEDMQKVREKNMIKRVVGSLLGAVLVILSICPVYAAEMTQVDTPNYKVAFYESNCYHMQDADGKKTGYGYEMMQGVSKYVQGTFYYVGYDKSPQECEEMLRNGELDIYTAAKITPERQEEFAISKHPAITSTTSMNVKAGNTKVVAGDYSTYNGLRIGLLERHTYNDAFIAFTKEKGFDCEIVYYETPTELTNALIHDEVDALVNSYIRTPLNVVLGMTQIAQKYKYDVNRLDSALDSIATEGNYLLSLANSILDVNQLEYGYVELVREPFDVIESTRDSVEILRPLADNKEQHLNVTFDKDHQVVVGDANRFRQIMINIISNAIKYTDAGGTINVKLESLENNRCRFICSDNGIGMSPEFITHIFEDYARAEDSRISRTEGTGLGMSVVKGFTDLMKGTLDIQSELGKGSTFTVEIPFEEASKEQWDSVLHPIMEDEEGHARFHGKRVLLVEDNALNAEIATELLQSIGLIVDWAENGKEGVERFEASEKNEYFAVFMDMQMPVMDGIEATKLIRGSEREDNNIPIFAMTANTFASDRKRCQEAGMTGYIPKPVNIKDIEGTLAENT